MKVTKYAAAAFALGASIATVNAQAASSCNIVGTYTDSLGSTIIFKSAKTGTAKNSVICASTYVLTVSKDTSTAINVGGTAKGCGHLSGHFKPNYPACTSATGEVTIKGTGTFNDTLTKKSSAVPPREMPDISLLDNGLR